MLLCPHARFDMARVAISGHLLSAWVYTDKGGDPEVVRESQRRRFADVAVVDRVIELDQEWKAGADKFTACLCLVRCMTFVLLYSYITYGDPQDAAECIEQTDWGEKEGQNSHRWYGATSLTY